MPYIEEIARWKEEGFNELSAPRKQAILENYFDKNIADDAFIKLPEERKSRIKSNFIKYHIEEETPPSAPAQELPQPQEESTIDTTGRVLGAGLKGTAEGLTTELPSLAGRAMQFLGSGIPGDITRTMRETTAELGGDPGRVPTFEFTALKNIGKDLKDWAELKRQQWYGAPKKREGVERIVYEGTKMLAPSILPAAVIGKGVQVLKGVGGLVKAAKAAEIAGDVARAAELMDKAGQAANLANKIASVTSAGLFGLSQAQETKDIAEEQAKALETQGKFEEAKKVREASQGIAPLATGTIEAAGEYFGTKYLGILFGLDEAGIAKRGAMNIVKDFIKSLGVEVSTEVGQQLGEAYIEKETGIRPEADPVAEALSVIGPTAFMTLLTGGAAGAIDMARQSTDSVDLLQEEQKKVTPDKDVIDVELIKKKLKEFREEATGPPSTAEEAAAVLAPLDVEARIQEEREAAQETERLLRLGLRLPEEYPSAKEAAEVFEEQLPEEVEEPPISPRTGLVIPEEKPVEPEKVTAAVVKDVVDEVANEAATSPLNDLPQPTEAQKEAGNYKKGHVNIQGLDISIENPKGSERTGKDSDGETWSTTMKSHYGYIKETIGKDKDHLDVFIGDDPNKDTVYVVDQINPDTGEFDEHKVLIGFSNMRAARKGYLENYEKGWRGLGTITKMPIGVFMEWSQNKEETQKPLKYEVPKDATQIRGDQGQRIREEKGQLESPEQEGVTLTSEEEALRQRPAEGRPDIQLPEEARGKASDREGVLESVPKKLKKRFLEEISRVQKRQDISDKEGAIKFLKQDQDRIVKMFNMAKNLNIDISFEPNKQGDFIIKAGHINFLGNTPEDVINQFTRYSDKWGTDNVVKKDKIFQNVKKQIENFLKQKPKIERMIGDRERILKQPWEMTKEEFGDKIKTEETDKGIKLYSVETEAGKKLRESIPLEPERRIADKPFEGPEKRLQEPLSEAEREKMAKTGKYPAFPGEVPRTLDLVKTVFPGQDIKKTATGFEVTLKNGVTVQVDRVAKIIPEAEGKPTVSKGEYIAGVYIRTPGGKTAQIKVSTQAGVTTLHHESIHLLEDFGIITKQEAGRINRHIKQAKLWDNSKSAVENRAEWLANEINKPPANTKMGRIWTKIKNFIGSLINKFGVRTVGGIARDIKTGKIYEKEAVALGEPAEQYSVEREGTPTEEDIEHPSLLRRQFDELVYYAQDKFNYLNKAQQEAERRNRAELPEEQDAYLAETRYHGMAAAAIEDFQEEYVNPILELMSSNDIDIAEVDEYLHARHAKEANARLKEINPDRPDNEALSGMTDSEADRILTDIDNSPKAEVFQSLGKMVDQVTKAQRDVLLESGQESAETIKQWEETYDNYVPLMREGKAEGKMPRRGRGFDVRGKQKIRAGSTRRVINILAHAVANTEAAIIRTEKIKVSRAFLAFAQENPGPWKIDTVEYSPRFNSEGIIEYRPDPLYRTADNVMIVKTKDGVNHRIIFDESNLNAMRIASAMKNLDAQAQGGLVRILSKITRWLAMMNTSLNPEFIISNFFRDIQTAGYNISDSAADKVRGKVFKDVKNSWRGIRDFQKGNKGTEWAKWYDRFRKAGAQVGWAEAYSDIIDRQNKMISAIKNMRPGKAQAIRRGLNSVMNFIEHENTAVENAVRLSIFKNLVESGASEAKAASIAKESTVNFNRKGAMGQALNSLYLFYNASIQGSTRIIQAAAKSPKVRKLMAGTVAFAAALDIVNRTIGGKDDDGEDRYDKIAPWIKERNLIIMLPNDKGYAQIPLPWGYNIFHVMGQTAGEAITKKDFMPLDGAERIAGATISSFNPVGGEASILQVLSPTLTDPIVQWAENKDWTGRKLRPDYNVFSPKPASQTYWSSVREPSRIITEKLNELTGGDVIKPGKIDISPEAIDLAIDTFTGSTGKFVANLISTPIKAIKGEDIETYEVPIFRRLYGRTGRQALTSDFYENMDAVQLVERQLKHYRGDKKKVEEIRAASSQEIKSIRSMKAAKKALTVLRKAQKDAIKIQNPQRRKKRLEAINNRINLIMKNFNSRYKQQEREK